MESTPKGAPRLVLLLFILSLLAVPSGTAAQQSNKDRLNGTWVVDIDATIDVLMQSDDISADDVEQAREMLATVKVTYDLQNGTFTGEMGGGPPTVMKIEKLEEQSDGIIHITGEAQDDLYRFRPDGTLLVVNSGLVLKKPD